MPSPLTENMPLIRAKFRIGTESLDAMQAYYDSNMEVWPAAIPQEIEVPALVDTGASITILDAQLIEQMRLKPQGYCNISGFDSDSKNEDEVSQYPNYEMGIRLLNSAGEDSILNVEIGQIVGHHIATKDFSAIIGMDVLAHCNFILDGPNECFELSAPEQNIEEISSVRTQFS